MIRTIIIDDEEDARESLSLSLEKFCPDISIVAICQGPNQGLLAIEEHQPQLIFLDVQMPQMSGFEMLKKIPKPSFQTIFVTAYDKYAIKAIRFSALDYLLKPVDIDDLLSAVSRAKSAIEKPTPIAYKEMLNNVQHKLGKSGKLAVPTTQGMQFLDIEKIILCEASGSYSIIHMVDKESVMISKSLKDFENILDPQQYCRVHHSSLINLNQVETYVRGEGGYVIMTNGRHVDISRRKKEEFMRLIAKI